MPNNFSLDLELSSTQYASITDAAQVGLDITGNHTVQAWVKPESATANFIVTGKRDGTFGRGYGMAIFSDGSLAGIVIDASDNNSTGRSAASQVPTGSWTHITYTYTLSGSTVALYVNGSLVANSGGNTTAATQAADTSEPFTVGVGGSGAANPYDGLVDEVRVWNYVRTAGEILADYNKVITPKSKLKGYWRFEAGSGTSIVDSSGNGNTLTTTNSPSFSTDKPTLSDLTGGMFIVG